MFIREQMWETTWYLILSVSEYTFLIWKNIVFYKYVFNVLFCRLIGWMFISGLHEQHLISKNKFTEWSENSVVFCSSHVDGKSGDDSQSTKQFWSKTALQHCVVDGRNKTNKQKNIHKMAPYSSSSVIHVTGSPEIPNWSDKKTLFMPSTPGRVCASTSDRLLANAISLAATQRISV